MTRSARTVTMQASLLATVLLMAGCAARDPVPETRDPVAYLLADAMLQVASAPAPTADPIYRLTADPVIVPPERPDDGPLVTSINWTGSLLGLMDLAGQYFGYEVLSEPGPPAAPVLIGLRSDAISLDRLVTLADAAAGDAAVIHLDHDTRRLVITAQDAVK